MTTVVYGGRRHAELKSSTTSSWDVLPQQLHALLEDAEELILVDPLSFPYESLNREGWDIPMTVAVPADIDIEAFSDLLAEPLVSKLTVLDQFIADEKTWNELRGRLPLSPIQWVPMAGLPINDVIERLLATRPAWNRIARTVVRTKDPRTFWAIRSREVKAQIRVISTHLSAALRRFVAHHPRDCETTVAIVGGGPGRWSHLARAVGAGVYTFDRHPVAVDHARLDGSIAARRLLEGDSLAAAEGFNAVVIVFELSSMETRERAAFLEKAWTTLTVGGALMVVDDFVNGAGFSTVEFERELLDASFGTAALSDAVAFSSDGGPRARTGLLVYTKLGSPQRW